MADLIIRRMPADMHRKLKDRAARNRRSMNSEVLAMLEEILLGEDSTPIEPPQPFSGRLSLNDDFFSRERT